MRRLARILLNTLTVLSLVLCTATLVLWMWGYYVGHFIRHPPRIDSSDGWIVGCARGRIGHICPLQYDPDRSPPRSRIEFFTISNPDVWEDEWNMSVCVEPLGLAAVWSTWDPDARTRQWMVLVPCWVVAAVTAALPLWRWRRHLGRLGFRRLREAGLCPSCGYDLRATPGRCPECGKVPAGPVAPLSTLRII